ncbi:MAG: AsmA family protein [Lewinellaceae bacterium]|nr:AsmA family protein [Lewinellaceae bacterium]
MKKFLKRLAIILVIFIVVLVGAVAVIASLFEDKVGQQITRELNKQLKSELVIQDFGLTVIRSFPNVAANLKGVTLEDTRGGALLEAQELSFRFGLMSLFSSKIKVRSVVISDGALNIEVDRQGNPNYNIFKESEEAPEEGGSSTAVALELARLRNIELIYADQSTRQEMAALVNDATFSGEFSAEKFSLKSEADITSRFADLDGIRYLPGKKITYDASILVNLEEGSYDIEEAVLNVEDNAFKVDGTIESWESGTYFDLFASGDDGNLEGVLALLPEQYAESLQDFSSSGKFVFNALVKGQYNERQNPEVRVEFGLEDGRLSSPRLDNPLKDVSFNAIFTNGKFRDNSSSVFTLESFKGYFNRELVEMRLEVANFDEPVIDFSLDGVAPLESVYGLLGNPRVTGGSGEVEIKKLRLKGAYKDMIDPGRISRVEASGALEFDDAALSIKDEEILFDRGELRLEGNRMAVEGLRIEGAGSDISFMGSAYNILPVFFADSLNSQDVELLFDASLVAKSLDIDRLMKFSTLTEEEEQAPEEVKDSLKVAVVQKRQTVTSFLKGSFNADVEAFNYNLIEGNNFKGKLEFDNNIMGIRGEVTAFNGQLLLDGKTYFQDEPHLEAKLTCKAIDVTEFFRQSENFGQDVLQSQNLKGKLDALIAIYAYWDEEGNFDMDKLRVLAGVAIKNGELRDFGMLESFSSFVKIKDLERINFVDVQNYLEIRKQRLYLPAMFIRSNALNLTVSGEHTFGNEIEYNIKVNAGQVLAERFKRYDPSLKPKPAKRSGTFNLYYAILGTIDDYNIVSSKRRVKSDFEQSEIRKREIQRGLEQAFGAVQLLDEPEEWKDNSEYNPGQEEYLDFDMEGGG